jgi:hypothetical protein
MLGGCECGCGNARAHAGVGFGSLSIQFEFEGKKEVNPHRANASHLFDLLIKFVKFVKFIKLHRSIGSLSFLPASTTTMHLPFQFLRSIGLRDRHLGAKRDEEVSNSKGDYVSSPNQAAAEYFTQYPNQWARIRLACTPKCHY